MLDLGQIWWPMLVVHYLGQKIVVQGQTGQKLARLYLKNKLGLVVHACSYWYLGGRGRSILSLRLAWAKEDVEV
jgi:hypothetical protein